MSTALRLLYNGAVIPAARLARPVAERLSPKLRRGMEARRGLFARWEAVARDVEGRRPRLWFHAASAGETLQARPLVEAVRAARPGAAIFHSFFSPSAEGAVDGWEAPDGADYLPLDVPSRQRRLVELLAPDALVLVGAELWPNLTWTATDRGVPVAQACCRFGPNAGRLSWPVRALTRDLYPRLAAIGAVSGEDAGTLADLGVPVGRIGVTGDTRVDVTLDRAAAGAGDPPAWQPPEGAGPVVVAGSTWPSDEGIVLDAVARLRERRPGLVAVVAPHEPDPGTIDRLEAACTRRGLPAGRLGMPTAGVAVVLVDRVGILYRLYRGAAAAYVGGGFDGAVHNTMEPAAHVVPVAIGPDHGRPHEVVETLAGGGLAVVRSVDELVDVWGRWLDGDGEAAGRAARRTLERLAGATGRTLELLRTRGLPL